MPAVVSPASLSPQAMAEIDSRSAPPMSAMNTALVTEIMPAMQSNRATSNSRPG